MKIKRKQKQKLIIYTLVALTLVLLLVAIPRVINSAREWKKTDYGKFIDKKIDKGHYSDIYYLKTTYKNETFKVINDNIIGKNGYRHVVCSKSGTLDNFDSEEFSYLEYPYSDKYKANEVIELYLSEDDYKSLVDGYSEFKLTGNVVTVILLAGTDYGYANTYFERTDFEPKVFIASFLEDMNENAEVPSDIYLMDMEGEKLQKYIKQNKFVKFTEEKGD